MPTDVEQFGLYRAIKGIERALKTISREDGFNTTPKVQAGAVILDKIPDASFPFVCFEMGDLAPDTETLGGTGQGLIRMDWPCFVWGYVRTTESKRALYRAGSALLADIYAAVYADETFPDGDGVGTVLFANPGEVAFDMESFSADKKGYLVAEFRLVVDVTRGSNP